METPDQLEARLDVMGEQRVRALIAKRHFNRKQIPMIEGWLTRKEQQRTNGGTPRPDPEELLQKARALARQAGDDAAKARELARQAGEAAKAAQRFALVGVGAGGLGLLISVLMMFVLALR